MSDGGEVPQESVRQRGSLVARVLLPVAVIILVASTTAGIMVAERVRADALESHAAELVVAAEGVRAQLAGLDWPSTPVPADVPLAVSVTDRFGVDAAFAVTAPGAAPIAGNPAIVSAPLGEEALSSQQAQAQVVVNSEAGPMLVGAVPLARQGADGFVLYVAADAARIEATAGRVRNIAFVAGLAAVALAAAALVPLLRTHDRALRERAAAVETLLAKEQAQRAALAEVDAMKNAFLTAVSHELRTPLTVIKGMSQVVSDHAERMTPDKLSDMMGRVEAKVDRLDMLLNDLLDIDRLARGVLEPRRRPMHLQALVRTLVDDTDLGRHTVRLPENDMVAEVDPGHVERIVENLLRNALQYTPDESNVWIRLENLDGDAVLVVEDDGPGIPDDMKRTMFQPLLGGNPDAANPGLGSGLALVQRLAEIHGGGAWIEDRPGGGACVKVRLPDA